MTEDEYVVARDIGLINACIDAVASLSRKDDRAKTALGALYGMQKDLYDAVGDLEESEKGGSDE